MASDKAESDIKRPKLENDKDEAQEAIDVDIQLANEFKDLDLSSTKNDQASARLGHSTFFSDPISLGAFLNILFPLQYQTDWVEKLDPKLKPTTSKAFFELHKITENQLNDYMICFTS